MAYSSNSEEQAVRGFIPARNDEERFIMRRAEDIFRTAEARCVPRHSGFLSSREQDLCKAAMNRVGCTDYRLEGGYPDAERKVLLVQPKDCLWEENPVQCLRLELKLSADSEPPLHKDYLGSLMGLDIERTCLGDILLDSSRPGVAYLFLLEDKVDFILRELTSVGKFSVKSCLCDAEEVNALPRPERKLKTGTVPSLRLDAVLSEIIGTGRNQVSEFIAAGRVEINHLPEQRQHAPVYAGDIFTVRGKGRYQLTQIKGKSKKDRVIIEYFQY